MANENERFPYAWKEYARNIPFTQILEEWKEATEKVYQAFKRYYNNPPDEVSEAEGEKLLCDIVTCATAFKYVFTRMGLSKYEGVYKECLNGQPKTPASIEALQNIFRGIKTNRFLEKYLNE